MNAEPGSHRHQIKSDGFDIQPELDEMGELASVLISESYSAIAVKVVIFCIRIDSQVTVSTESRTIIIPANTRQ